MRRGLSRSALLIAVVVAFAAITSAQPGFQSEGSALACAYVDIDLLVPSHALHYLNGGPLDVNIEPDRSEDLLDTSDEAALCNRDDPWQVESAFGRSVLHAWVCLGNPNSVFSDFNPRVD